MLIGGIGLTLDALADLVADQADAEIQAFLEEMDRTYRTYQSEAGCLLAATGWHHEADIVPSTAWQSHDLFHLVRRHGVEPGFWDSVFSPMEGVCAVFGHNAVWTETDSHFALRGYVNAGRPEYVGRKDTARFALDIPGWIAGNQSPDHLHMPDEPRFIRADDVILQVSGRDDVVPLYATNLRLERDV